MTESYRAHYLLTSLAVVKRTCFDQSTGMWTRVQDEDTPIIAMDSAETRRKAIPTETNYMSIPCNNCACNSYIYHHHVLTCNMSMLCSNCNKQNMHQARYL